MEPDRGQGEDVSEDESTENLLSTSSERRRFHYRRSVIDFITVFELSPNNCTKTIQWVPLNGTTVNGINLTQIE
jgi:hypothetical protein